MAEVRIKVGAKLTPDFDNALRSMREAAARANRAIGDDAQKTARVRGASAKSAANEEIAASKRAAAEAKKADREKATAAKAAGKEREKAAKDAAAAEKAAIADTEKAAKNSLRQQVQDKKAADRERVKAERDMQREILRAKREAANEEKELLRYLDPRYAERMRRKGEREITGSVAARGAGGSTPAKYNPWKLEMGRGGLSGAAHDATFGAARGALSFGRRLASDLISGTGVEMDLGTHVRSNISLQAAAARLSNQGFQPGAAGANGFQVGRDDLTSEARAVAKKTAMDPNAIIEGLSKFTDITGDLDTGRQVMEKLAVLSRATGANFGDMSEAAGNVAAQLGDMPDKADVVEKVMRVVASQGKLGAVEVKDMATQMAKVAAAASKFEGSKERTLTVFGAITQEARQRGGAASATQAATAAQSFANQFGKNARLEGFKSFGIDVYSKTNKGMVRDPQELITELLSKTRGDPSKMGHAIADSAAQRAVGGFRAVYNESYNATPGTDTEKDKAAVAAVTAEFERLTQTVMSTKDVNDAFRMSMDTTEAKVQVFNDTMMETTNRIQEELLPALEDLAPTFIEIADAVADFLEKLTGKEGDRNNKKGNNAVLAADSLNAQLRNAVETGQLDPKTSAMLEKQLPKLQAIDKAQTARVAGELDDKPFKTKDGGGQFGGYLTEADQAKASRIERDQELMRSLHEAVKEMVTENKRIGDGLLNGGIVIKKGPPGLPTQSPTGTKGPGAN